MRVLIACESSGIVREQFRLLGHDAWSCDLVPSEIPGNHIQGDVSCCLSDNWDLMIAFPPCTDLANCGARWFPAKVADGRQQMAIDFFLSLVSSTIPRIAVENPLGIMSTYYRKPDQIIHPYFFGDSFTKSTCLWLKSLPKLVHFPSDDLFGRKTHVYPGDFKVWKSGKRAPAWSHSTAPYVGRSSFRSRTFPGVASAMAIQWGI